MATVTIVKTTALYPSAVFLQWIVDAPGESGSFLFNVARAGGPDGPWEFIATDLKDTYCFLDDHFNLPPAPRRHDRREGLNLFSLARTIYYQVTAIPPSGIANQFVSDPTPVEPGLDNRTRLIKRKILFDEAKGFHAANGVPIIVLKRRHWGTRCRECWDPVTKDVVKEHCGRCFGTSFEGGYWTPTLIAGRKSPGAIDSQLTAQGESEVKLVTFMTLDYPLLEYKDVLVDLRFNDRFLVQRVTRTELKGVPVHQNAVCSEISRDAVEYEVLVDPVATPPLY